MNSEMDMPSLEEVFMELAKLSMTRFKRNVREGARSNACYDATVFRLFEVMYIHPNQKYRW